jgi:V/A-type H+-transporting ATPase subunit K
MSWLIAIIFLNLICTLVLGIYFEFRPVRNGALAKKRWVQSAGVSIFAFFAASAAALLLGMQDALAAQAPHGDISVGLGLALIGAGIPTALATVGAGLAVGPVGAASLAVIAEKPEMFGRTLIYLGLAEGIAIYGLVVTILLLGKIA